MSFNRDFYFTYFLSVAPAARKCLFFYMIFKIIQEPNILTVILMHSNAHRFFPVKGKCKFQSC